MNVSQLRSFLGLANQLTAFVPDLAHMTAELRPLLKKGIAWTWTEDIDKEFERVKLLLTTTTTVQPFNPSLKSILMTDTSKLQNSMESDLLYSNHCQEKNGHSSNVARHLSLRLSQDMQPSNWNAWLLSGPFRNAPIIYMAFIIIIIII